MSTNDLQTNSTGSNNTAVGYGADVSSSALSNATAIGFNAKVAASNSLVLGGTGNDAVKVGIGTTTPGYTLEVRKDVTGGLGPTLHLMNGGGSSGSQVNIDINTFDGGSATPGARIAATDNSFSANLDFQTKAPGALNNAMTSRLYVQADGNIGVGLTKPTAKLDINGTTKIGTNGTVLSGIIKSTLLRDVTSVASGASLVVTFTVTNAALGATVHVSPEQALADGLLISYARVSAANTVEVKFRNTSAAAIDPVLMNYYITVIQ